MRLVRIEDEDIFNGEKFYISPYKVSVVVRNGGIILKDGFDILWQRYYDKEDSDQFTSNLEYILERIEDALI